MERWVGKTAIVTGASVGIGAAIAVSLANAGVNVVGLARKVEPFEELKKTLKSGAGQLVGKKCDVSNKDEISSIFAWVNDTFGGIHILVNNAGCVKNGTLTDVGLTTASLDDIEAVLKLNVLGLLACSQEAVTYMKQTGVQGHIIHVSSMLGHYVHTPCLPMMNIYYGSKHAVRACTDAMRLEFAYTKTNIRVTSVSPAAVNTDFLVTGSVPLGEAIRGPERLVASLESQDVADAVLYAIATPPRVNVMDVLLRPMGDIS